MKTNFRVVIILAGFLLGTALFLGAATAVHAEDVTPTPDVTPTESATPAPTEPTQTETPTPDPTTSPTPDPVLTETPEEGLGEVMALSSPMLMAAAVTKPVWFNSSFGLQEYDNFSLAFADINLGLIPSDGLIHVEKFYAGGEIVSVLSLYYDTGKPYSSTSIKGIIGPSLDPSTNSPDVTISTPLEFMNFTGGFTISNICVDTTRSGEAYGAITLSNMSGTQNLKNLVVTNHDSTSSGIMVETLNGSIVVTNVDASGNAGGGAYLRTGTSGSITVTNSSFNENGGVDSGGTIVSGLVVETINSNSSVTFNGVSASGNSSPNSPGVLIKKSGPITIKNSMFNNNLGGGIRNVNGGTTVTIQGSTTLDNVTASDNHSIDLIHGGSGIELYTNGAITANNIYATGNLNYGMKLDNCNLEASVCKSTVNGAVVVSNSEFSENELNSGLAINSRGSVTLTKVKANDNPGGQGIIIDNSSGTAGVTLNGTGLGDNQVNGNGIVLADIDKGAIEITSKGNILVNYLQAGNAGWENQLSGAVLKNLDGSGTITVNNSSFQHNLGQGLVLRSKKNITLKNVTAENNEGDFGVDLDNYAFGAGTGNVLINGSAMRENGRLGLNVVTQGTITIGTSDVSNNPDGGANLENHAPTVKSMAITKSTFNENAGGNGLTILNLGNITFTGVSASENGLGGFELLDDVINIGSILINNSINPNLYNFSGNVDFGLNITTKGGVTLTGVNADNMTSGVGAVIDNSGGVKSVLISSSHFNENQGGDGLYVKSSGAITLTKTSASGNSGWGARLHNDLASKGILAISINNDPLKLGMDLNGFSGNGAGGLEIGARGPVNLTNVEANGNTGNGGFITNFAGSPADVKITNSYFDLNEDDGAGGGYGLYVESMGNITLTGGSASENFLYGATLDNQRDGAFPIKNITINKFTLSENETGFGLEAHANGTITTTSVKTDGNATFGAHLDNRLDDILLKDSGLGIVVKTSSFSLNEAGIGLEIQTAGSVLLDGVTANSNTGGEGVKVTSTPLPLSIKPVTVNRSSANGNSLDGLKVDAVGLITLNGVTANGNLLSGAVLDNSSATTTTKPGVTIQATLGTNNFNGNRQGLTMSSRGPVSLTSVTANFSTHNSGIYINNQNCSGDCPKSNVSLNKVTTRGNYGDGVHIFETNGALITLTGLISLSNGGSGVYIHSFNEFAKISILSGLFMGNSGYGIDVIKISTYPLVLTGTSYFGNDTGNLFIH